MSPRFLVLFAAVAVLSHPVTSDDEDKQLFTGINSYRTSLNLSALKQNDNAECLAEQVVEQFKSQPCTNTTGANTVPGTEAQLPNFLEYLDHCHLNISNTRDGVIMPACVPGLSPDLVLTNYTQSLYSGYMNDSQYTGAGIASAEDWMVVVLSTDTPSGSFVKADSSGSLRPVGWGVGLIVLLCAPLMFWVN